MNFCVRSLFGIYYMDSIYDLSKQKEHMWKFFVKNNLTIKKLWTFEWLKMNHIFISPYHNHFCVNFKKKFLTCTL